jgi:recombination protein RecA
MLKKDLSHLLKRTVKPPIPASDFLSTGSTLLNLACSGYTSGGVPKGTYVFMPGQSQSGKTWIAMSIFAEAKKSKRFEHHRLIRKDTERGALMNVGHYFGERVERAIEHRDYPNTTEAFYDDLDDTIDKKEPFIYVLDSEAGLQSEAGLKQIEEAKKARRAGRKGKGSYAGSSQKTHSQRVRTAVNRLEETGSILIVTGQVRGNMGYDAMFNPEVATGGYALFFWAHLRLWCRRAGAMKKNVNGKDRKVGNYVRITVDKSRVSGKERTVKLAVPNDFGIDDTGSMVQWLADEKQTGRLKGIAPKGSVDEVAEFIEAHDKEAELKRVVKQLWNEIEEKSMVKRKKRYP